MATSRLQLNLTANTSGFTSGLNSASSKLQQFGGKLKSIGGSMQKFALPLALAGGASVKMALDFDKSMTKIKALVGIAGGKVDEMGHKVKQLALDTGVSSREAADALFFITSAGIRGDEAMKVLEMSLKGAASGLGETKTIADLSTSAMNAYGSGVLSATDATDVLTAAVRLGKLAPEELAGAMGSVIPIASNMGVEFHEVGAAMAAMSKTGTNASRAATQLNAIFMGIQKPTDDAIVGLGKLGMTFSQLEASVGEQGLMPTLAMLKERMQGTDVTMKDLFNNIRAYKGVLDLTGASMADNVKLAKEMESTQGATATAFKITAEAASFKFRKAVNSATETMTSLGQQLLVAVVPAIQKLAGFIQNLWKRFKELSPTMQGIILAFGGLAIVLPTILTLLGSLISLFGALLSPVGLVVAAIVGVAYAFYKYWGQIKTVIVGVINWFIKLYNESVLIRGIVQAVGTVFKMVFDYIAIAINTGWKNFKAFGSMIWQLFKDVGNIIMGVFTLDWDVFKSGLSGAATTLADGITEIAKNSAEGLQDVGKAWGENISDGIRNTMKPETIEDVTEGMFSGMEEWFENKGKQLGNILGSSISSGVSGDDGTGGGDDGTGGGDGGDGGDGTGNGAIEEKIGLLEKLGWTAADTTMSIQNSFSQLGGSIVESMGLAGTALGDFLNNFLNMVAEYLAGQLQMMISDKQKASSKVASTTVESSAAMSGAATSVAASNISVAADGASAIAGAVDSGTKTAKGFGPLAAFVLPMLIAGAIAVVMSSMKKAKKNKFAKGGIISAPTMGLMGEYPGARNNPEVVAPLDKLKGLIGSSGQPQQVNVGGSFELRGQDLIVALERANSSRDRIL